MRKGPPINVSNFGKGKISEDMENLNEKNVPTNPELWSRAKSLARSKFDVYPSAYANGWASKWYKGKGGGWRSVSEETSSKLSVSKADVVSVQGVAEGTSPKLSAAPIKIGSIYRMKVNGSQTYGKVASINDDRGTVRLRRLNKDGSPYEGTGPDKDSDGRWIQQRHFHVTTPDNLGKRFQMDNMYGELVPYGTAKIPGTEPLGEDLGVSKADVVSVQGVAEGTKLVADGSIINVYHNGPHIGNIFVSNTKDTPYKAYSKHWDMSRLFKSKKAAADWLAQTHQTAIKEEQTGMAEEAPPGARAERMVKHIKKNYAKDGKLTPKERSIAYATAWKAHNRSVTENFADGRNPQDKGDSQRHGIPKGATMAELEKAAKASGRKGQLARWQLNMRRGRARARKK